MARKTKAINNELLEQCKLELKNHGRDGENGRRLQAIISSAHHGISAVAKVYGISRDTLMRWIRKFKTHGVEGFTVATGRGKKSKLTKAQKLETREYIIKYGATLSGVQLKSFIKERFDIEFSKASTHRILHELGFSYITPRPRHYKKNEIAVEEFKKKS